MRKIVLALLLVLSYGIALAGAPPAPPPHADQKQADADVTVDVIKPLSIEVQCPYCVANLPYVIIGSSIDITNHVIAFIITGEPGFSITMGHNGTEVTGGTEYLTGGVTMKGRWGSFNSGTTVIGADPSEWGAFPTVLNATTTPTLPAGTAYCDFIVDKLTAAPTAAPGFKLFTLNVWVEYTAI